MESLNQQKGMHSSSWICTDSSCFQYQKSLSDSIFDMIQAFEMPDGSFVVVKSIIDLSDYTGAEICDYVEAYYDSLNALKSEYGDDSNRIIAECVFESLQPIDYAYQFAAKNEEKAQDIILEIISRS